MHQIGVIKKQNKSIEKGTRETSKSFRSRKRCGCEIYRNLLENEKQKLVEYRKKKF